MSLEHHKMSFSKVSSSSNSERRTTLIFRFAIMDKIKKKPLISESIMSLVFPSPFFVSLATSTPFYRRCTSVNCTAAYARLWIVYLLRTTVHHVSHIECMGIATCSYCLHSITVRLWVAWEMLSEKWIVKITSFTNSCHCFPETVFSLFQVAEVHRNFKN